MKSQKLQNQFTGWTAVPPVSLLEVSAVNLSDPISCTAHLTEDKREEPRLFSSPHFYTFLPLLLLDVTSSHFGHPIQQLTFNHPLSLPISLTRFNTRFKHLNLKITELHSLLFFNKGKLDITFKHLITYGYNSVYLSCFNYVCFEHILHEHSLQHDLFLIQIQTNTVFYFLKTQ